MGRTVYSACQRWAGTGFLESGTKVKLAGNGLNVLQRRSDGRRRILHTWNRAALVEARPRPCRHRRARPITEGCRRVREFDPAPPSNAAEVHMRDAGGLSDSRLERCAVPGHQCSQLKYETSQFTRTDSDSSERA